MKLSETSTVICEGLESRTMMSAAPVVHAQPTPVAAAALTTAAKVAATAKSKLPALLANPEVTDSTISYTDFSYRPLFSGAGPSPNDVYQGDLGDCYFLSTLSAIAKVDPAVIRKDIVNNNDGTYTVNFVKGGTKDPVRVSADLPTWPDGELAYAGLGTGNSTWVAIMEKAFAEFRTKAKTYASLSGGWMSEVFGDLGIKSQSTYMAASATALGKLVVTDLKANDAATFATGDTIQDGASLIADHAYEIDSVNVDKTGKAVSLRLRNPWGVDGVGNDGHNDGYVTITMQQIFDNLSGMVVAKA
jgi:hypothetical protein